jgi:hypothetical protein
MSSQTRLRLAVALMISAALAFVFYRLAFSWWYWRAIQHFHIRWPVFEDWRWWVVAYLTGLTLLVAGFQVLAGDRKTRAFPKTPLEDPAHRLTLDQNGHETAPRSDPVEDGRGAPFSYVPPADQAAAIDDAPAERQQGARWPTSPSAWLLLAAAVALLEIDWFGRGASLGLLEANFAIAVLVVVLWLLARRSL